jgi:hypothetical protein
MIKVQVVEIDSGDVIHEIEVRDAKSINERRVERIESGLLRQIDMDKSFVRTIDTETGDYLSIDTEESA